jgi:hypothetical protein
MQPWIWATIIGIPVLATGAAYAMGAFSTDISGVNKKLGPYASTKDPEQMKNIIAEEKTAFTGDDPTDYGSVAGKRKHKTKKSKKRGKKTKRRS